MSNNNIEKNSNKNMINLSQTITKVVDYQVLLLVLAPTNLSHSNSRISYKTSQFQRKDLIPNCLFLKFTISMIKIRATNTK